MQLIHKKGIDGTGTRIAIIDTSPVTDPELFVQHSAIEKDRIEIRNKADTISDNNDHAIVCTSIAVGRAFWGLRINPSGCDNISLHYPGGVAPGAKATVFLVNLKNLDTVIAAIDEVNAGDYDVLSLSFGDPDNQDSITECLEKLKGKTIIVAAAGNSGNNRSVAHPAKLPNVISVGSLDDDFKPSGFSAENRHVDTYYCGEVLAPCRDPTGCMLKISIGTSMATAGIAGLVCLLMQCAIKHGYEVQMRKKENMMKLLDKVIEKNDGKPTHNLDFLIKAYEEKETFEWIDINDD